jgi:hypothetical protein
LPWHLLVLITVSEDVWEREGSFFDIVMPLSAELLGLVSAYNPEYEGEEEYEDDDEEGEEDNEDEYEEDDDGEE